MSQTVTPEKASRKDQYNKIDQYLVQQLAKTGSQVRVIDLFTSAMALFAGLLAALFALAIIDAWIVELGTVTRWICLVGLLAGAAYYVGRVIIPLAIRRINPAYSAQMIESSQPKMHNGLVNYVYLRDHQDKSHKAVINAVANRAATDISGVVVENTVDKSHTLRAAIILTALVVVFGIYKVVSPKDPFQTFARVLVPSSDIAKPASVTVSDVKPGNTAVYFGQPLTVTARITGSHDPNKVRLVYSTDDGQLVDARIPMELTEQPDVYQGVITTDATGIQQSLQYRVIAEDGYSNIYRVSLKSTPTLSVTSIEYDPPKYTKLPSKVIAGSSEIEALDGTSVTINATSNTPIQTAYVELLSQIESGEFRTINNVSMKTQGETASCKFALNLEQKRVDRQYTHYRMRFTTSDGLKSEPVAVYPIRITPDLAPQLTVLQPEETEIELPVNGLLRFEAQASDPDFEIDRIQVTGLHLGATLFQENMPLGNQDRAINVRSQYDFVPSQHRLRDGDTVIVHLAAYDNRRSTKDIPDPNMTRSENYTIKITKADESLPDPQQQQPGQQDQADQPEATDDNNQQESGEESQQEGNTGQSSENSENPDQDSSNRSGSQSDEQSGNEQSDENENQQEGNEQSNQQEESGSDSSESSNDSQSEQNEQLTDQSNENQSENSSSESSDEQSESSGQAGNSSDSPDQSESTDSQSGTGQGESSSDESSGNQQGSDSSTSSSDQTSGRNADEISQGGDINDQSDYSLEEDAHPGEVFERVLEYQEQQNQVESDPNNQESGEDSGDNSENSSSDTSENEGQESEGNESDASNADENSGDQEGSQSDSNNQEQSSSENASENSSEGNQGEQSTGQSSESDANQENMSDQQQEGTGDSESHDADSDEQSGNSGTQQTDEQNNDQQTGNEGNQSESSSEQSSNQESGSSGSEGEQGSESEGSSEGSEGSSEGSESESGESASQSGNESSGDQNAQQPGDSASDQSSSESSDSGEQSGNQTGEGEQGTAGSGSSSDQPGSEGQPSDGNSSGDSESRNGEGQSQGDQPTGAGQQSGSGMAGSSSQPGNTDAKMAPSGPTQKDEANLEYSKKATDLALDYLEEQLVEPDPKLLDELNWTEDDLREFVKKWRELQKQAETGNDEDRERFEQSLKSLDLRAPEYRRERSNVDSDDIQGYQQDARVSKPPADLADKFRAFQKSRNRARKPQ